MAADYTISAAFKAINNVSGPFMAMNKSVSKFGTAAQKASAQASGGFAKVGLGMKNMVSSAMLMGGLTLGAGFIVSSTFAQIADFETALVGVGKTTDISGQKLTNLGAGIIKTSTALRVVSSEKLLELSESAGQLGVTGSKNILKFAETMAKLETASDIQGAEGASAVARLLTITKEGVGVVDQFAAALVGLGNTSAATESEILDVASEVARSTSAFSLVGHEILGIAAAMKSLDVAPQAAGTAVGKTFRGIEKALLKGGERLKAYTTTMGISSNEMKSLFDTDKVALFSKLISGLGRIKNEGGSVAATMESLGLSGEILAKGLAPLASNSDLLIEKLKLSALEFKKNEALEKEFAAASMTLNNALKSITIGFANFLNTAANTESTTALGNVRDSLFWIGENIGGIIKVLGVAIGLWTGYRLAMFAVNGTIFTYNLWLGLSVALGKKSVFAMRGNTGAAWAYVIAQKAATFATWLWNGAVTAFTWVTGVASTAMASFNAILIANPIGAVVVAIVLLIGLIAAAVTHYEDWGAAVLFLMGPLGLLINVIMSVKKHWDSITEAFSGGGFLAGITRIGQVLMDSVLFPLQQLFELMSGMPLIGGLAASGAAQIGELRAKMDLVNPSVSKENARVERQETIEQQRLDVNINNNSNGQAEIETFGNFAPFLAPTFQMQ